MVNSVETMDPSDVSGGLLSAVVNYSDGQFSRKVKVNDYAFLKRKLVNGLVPS